MDAVCGRPQEPRPNQLPDPQTGTELPPNLRIDGKRCGTVTRMVKEQEPECGPPNRRSEPRVALSFPIEVSGFNRSGKYFTEGTSCFDVGEASCAFTLDAEIAADSVVSIRSFHWQNSSVMESRPLLFQVVRLEKREQGWVVAAIRLQPEKHPSDQLAGKTLPSHTRCD
jgi:hypothetical protein